MKTQIDIIKMANEMQKERELQDQIGHEIPLPDPIKFEQSFNEIFCGDEFKHKPKRTDQDLIDSGHKHTDF